MKTFLSRYYLLLIAVIVCFSVSLFGAETVYCLHGFMRKSSSMNKMAKAFEKEGYEACSWDYPSRERTVEQHAEVLIRDLQETARKHPGEAIHFVTHSLGGIIVRAVHNHPNCPEEAKMGRAVLLAPPNQGSCSGQFLSHIGLFHKIMGGKAGRQILFSENFDYVGEFPEEKEVLVISGTCGWNPVVGGKNDGKVGVKESCLNTPHKHKTHFSGHSWMMYSDTVIYNALLFIEKND
ncbi:MAG: hypothetical protein KR126chlam3_01324 [Chlamydiae bacterium]|nr:hypothetical protein [Chlamydiota bacterium]